MRRCSRRVVLYLLCWLGLSTTAAAETFEVGFYDYPPMMIERDNSGIYKDLFDELGVLLGDVFNIRYYPYPRIGLLFNGGQLDIEPGVYAGWMRGNRCRESFRRPLARSST